MVLLTIVIKGNGDIALAAAYCSPLDPAEVRDALRRVTGSFSPHQKRVLLIDDDPNVADMLNQTLLKEEFLLDAALDGIAGLAVEKTSRYYSAGPDHAAPGRIWSNRTPAQYPQTCNLPIIVVSGKDLTAMNPND